VLAIATLELLNVRVPVFEPTAIVNVPRVPLLIRAIDDSYAVALSQTLILRESPIEPGNLASYAALAAKDALPS
jgi:hypothetical protein